MAAARKSEAAGGGARSTPNEAASGLLKSSEVLVPTFAGEVHGGKLCSMICFPAGHLSGTESPISRGRLCPKGADTYELHTHSGRLTRVKYRRPYSRRWEELDLESAMDMVADRVWESRERSFQEKRDGETLMQTAAVAHLGGATLDNEENYLIKKLFTGGLGMVRISNQARI